jgi:hypothetical protein
VARALQCPGCRTTYPVGSLPDLPAFRCETCGRALKVPAQFRPHADVDLPPAPPPGRPPAAVGGPPVVSPAPSQRRPPREHTAVYDAPTPLQPRPSTAASPTFQAQVPPSRRRSSAAGDAKAPWWLLVFAWVVALPAGLFLVVYPARKLGFLSGQKLVDVIVGTSWGRYWRVLAIAPMWALVTTIIVQLILLAGRALARRRRQIRDEQASPASTSRRGRTRNAPAPAPQSRPPTNGSGRPPTNSRSVRSDRRRRS